MLKLGMSHGANSLDGETDSADRAPYKVIITDLGELMKEGLHDTMGARPGGLLEIIFQVVFRMDNPGRSEVSLRR